MLVKDLIEELKRCDPNTEVRVKIIHTSDTANFGKPKVDSVIIHSATIEIVE